jgi:Uma2 family endonuclease
MGLKATKHKRYTPEEYLALEEKAEFRSEYWDGKIVPLNVSSPNLSGASVNHIQIVTNLIEILSPKLKMKNCRTFSNDLKVWVKKRKKFFYPDVAIICGQIEFYQKRNDTILNPNLIIEVLSDSTESKDRGEKFLSYQSLETLQTYILVSQDKYLVEQYVRREDGNWIYQPTIGIKSEVIFESVGESLKLSEIYDLVEFIEN